MSTDRKVLLDFAFQTRTLINSAAGMLELATDAPTPHDRTEYEKVALQSIKDLSALVDGLLKDHAVSGPLKSQHTAERNVPVKQTNLFEVPEVLPSLCILLADDNEINRRVVTKFLSARGHRIFTANDGKQAVEEFGKREYDLILMDIKMPVMGGIEAARTIRKHEVTLGGHVPIIAITAVEESSEPELHKWMDSFIQKPFDSVNFISRIRTALAPYWGKKIPRDIVASSCTPLRLSSDEKNL